MPNRLILTAAILSATLIFGFIVVWPKYQDFQQTNLAAEQKMAELNSKTTYYSKIKEIHGKLEAYDKALAKVDLAVPAAYSIPSLFNYLQKTASETGLIIKDFIFNGVSGDKPKEIGINIKTSGSYSSFKSFLSAIESSERLFKVKNIQLSSPEKEEGFSFNLEISTYSY